MRVQVTAVATVLILLSLRSQTAQSSLVERTKHIFMPTRLSAHARTNPKSSCAEILSNSSTSIGTSEATTIDAQHECRHLLQGYDLLGTILGGQGHSWMLPYLRILTFSSRPVDEVKDMARKISASGSERRRQLRQLRQLSPDVSAKFVAPKAQQDNPFGKAIGNVMAYSIVGDLIDRSTDFDLNWVLLQISTARMIAATAKAMMSFEVNAERRAWLKEVAKEYSDMRNELRKVYIRGEGSASKSVGR